MLILQDNFNSTNYFPYKTIEITGKKKSDIKNDKEITS